MRRFINQLKVPALILAAIMLFCLPSVQAADDINVPQIPQKIVTEIINTHSSSISNGDFEGRDAAIQVLVDWLNENTVLSLKEKQAFLKNWLMENLGMSEVEAEELSLFFFPIIDNEIEKRDLEKYLKTLELEKGKPLTKDDQAASPF
jgi:hypothetical protein